MLPSSWPSWSLILIALGLTVSTVAIGLVLEPAVQAVTPYSPPAAETAGFPPRLSYAAPLSGGCVDCHTSEASLRDAGADDPALQRVLLEEDSSMTLHGRLGCVTCHDGIGTTQNIDAAHQDLVANPSSYEEADTYCLPCHHDLRTEIPEHNINTPHERILWGIHEDEEVCACSNCHGPVAHGEEPIRTHEFLASYCIDCHEERNVPPERHKCSGCHVGPHDVALAMDCETCHVSTAIWSKVQLAIHPMELSNGHAELECFECHIQPDFRNISGFACNDCHTKTHEFGGVDCAECHLGGASWAEIDEEGLNHQAVWEDPQDEQDHEDVACRGCHFEGYDAPLSTECESCHESDESQEG
ncbi:MAG: hypothetical protein PVH80_01795 [Anaerolineae bacterium]